jgi:FkbM family methyltransferase
MITFQTTIQKGRKLFPRGWSPFLRFISNFYPRATMYPAILKNSDTLYLDLSENMCHSYFYEGCLPNECYTEAFLKKHVKPGDVFLDIGANIGYFTRLVSKLVGDAGTVHAFEPMPKALRVLRKNTAALRNVVLHDIAVSDCQGVSNFTVRRNGDMSSLGDHADSASVISVKTDKLDNVLKRLTKVDWIKIDVEGYEYEVLKGAVDLIASTNPLIYFEFIENYSVERSIDIDAFKALLKPLGYSIGWISPNYPNSPLLSKCPSSYAIAVTAQNRWNIDVN